jgi:cytosolic phospholipase A2
VPAFPEAIGDIGLIKASFSVEAITAKDITDAESHPEIHQIAEVRRGSDLSPQELAFLAKRKALVRDAFCEYMGLSSAEVNAEDVPTVAFGGSGGGYRAMIGLSGYSEEMKKTGLWNVLTYVSGVSGSCWALAAYYTWSNTSMQKVIDHCKTRLHPFHPLSPEAVREVLQAPGGPAQTLGPLVQKSKSGLKTVAMDLYSVFTTGHLFLQQQYHQDGMQQPTTADQTTKSPIWMKWTSASKHLQEATEPLPILTAVRHERPWKNWVDKEHPFKEPDPHDNEHQQADDAWFQWFEISPYEIGCDELQAWCPTWGFARPFEHGRSTMQLPEQSLALLLGLCVSAPAGPMTSYLATIKRMLPHGFLGNSIQEVTRGMAARLWGKQGTEEFTSRHPLHASNERNFMFKLTESEPEEGQPIENSPRIHLIDSGMDNNCPTYVMLRPRREVDVILNLDASSDVLKDSFQQRVDQIGSRRGLKFTKRHPELKVGENVGDPDRFKGMYAQIYDGSLMAERPERVIDSYDHEVDNPPAPASYRECTMVYMPLLPNEPAVHDFDPSTAKFSGSYNLVWTPEQIQMLIDVSAANFKAGENTVKLALRDAWQRNKARREGQGAAGQ